MRTGASTRWPIVLHPSVDASFIPLLSLSFRLLRSDLVIGQPLAEIIRTIRDAEGLLDKIANSPAGPEVGRIGLPHVWWAR